MKGPFDRDILKAYLTLRYAPSTRSIFSGESRKISARLLVPDEMKRSQGASHGSQLSEQLVTVCKEIIRTCSSSGSGRICAVTSGGIDSGAIVGLLSSLDVNFEAVTMGFDGPNDEIADAEELCDHFGVRLHKFISKSVLSSTSEAVSKLGIPYRGVSFCFDLSRFIRSKGFDIVFDGLGVDEFFGGYGFRYERVLRMHSEGTDRLSAYLRGSNPLDFVEETSELFGEKLSDIRVPWAKLFPCFDNDLPFLDQVFMADYNGKCVHNFFPLADLYRMFELRPIYPWLSDRFIDFSLTVPTHLKFDPQTGNTKILFRKAFERLLPTRTLTKKKQGFGPDLDAVWSRELRDATEETVMDGYMVSEGYLNKEFFRKALRDPKPSPTEKTKCWEVYCLEKLLQARKHGGTSRIPSQAQR